MSDAPHASRAELAAALVRAGAIGCWAVAAWLAFVAAAVLPARSPTQIPMWIAVLAGFAIVGGISWWHAGHAQAVFVRRLLWIAAPLAIALGAFAIAVMATRQDFEGYIVLMGAGLAAHGGAVLLHLFATRDVARAHLARDS
jgi:hypothetical protein